jgi:antitoxin VapB
MALQIANPVVVDKIHELARMTGMTKTAAVEKAVDEMLKVRKDAIGIDRTTELVRMQSLLAQFDRTRPNSSSNSAEAIAWDEFGLPT